MSRRALLCLLALLAPATLAGAEPCELPDAVLLAGNGGSGVGGTGYEPEGGVGGTGVDERGGVGGTGVDERGGVGGTGRGDDSGVGGTGYGDDSGVGGTGLGEDGGVGGTGVLGTVTGFGSLCVNGLRIAYDTDAEVVVRGESGRTEDLAVGQLVWLIAHDRRSLLFTDRIEVVSAVLDSIRTIDEDERSLVVGERTVLVPDGTPIVDAITGAALGFAALAPGDVLDVAALPAADGRLVASRVERHERMPAGRARYEAIRERIARGEGLARVSIEGYARLLERPERLSLSGVEVVVPERTAADARLIVDGPIRDGAVRAERVRVRVRMERGGALRRDARPLDGKSDGAAERPDSGAKQRPATSTRPERPETSSDVEGMRPERPERLERPERIERPEQPARPEIERPEVLDRPDRIERPPTQDTLSPIDIR